MSGGEGGHKRCVRSGGPYSLFALIEATGLTWRGLATAIGIDRATVRRAREAGLDDRLADEWAVAMGFHPAEVWPHWLLPDAAV